MSEAKRLPNFTSEAEEAKWYIEHQDELLDYFEEERVSGAPLNERLNLPSVEESLPKGSTSISIRLQNDDLDRAKAFAAKKGLKYQTYLKMLLHQALDREEMSIF